MLFVSPPQAVGESDLPWCRWGEWLFVVTDLNKKYPVVDHLGHEWSPLGLDSIEQYK